MSEYPFLQQLELAKKHVRIADHLIYMTLPVVKEAKLLLTVLEEMHKATHHLINSVLQKEYLFKQISLSKDPKTNLHIFFTRCANAYNLTPEEITALKAIIHLHQLHKASPVEYAKKESVVILDEEMRQRDFTIDTAKKLLAHTKSAYQKVKTKLQSQKIV